MRQLARIGGLVMVGALVGAVALAGTPQPVDNPYQGEFPFTLGEPLEPGVSIDGVVWTGLRVAPQGKLRSGKAVKTQIELAFDNGTAGGVEILVVVLFEDEHGQNLDRVDLGSFSLAAGRNRRFRKKVKIQSDVLSAAKKVYLFCEVRPR